VFGENVLSRMLILCRVLYFVSCISNVGRDVSVIVASLMILWCSKISEMCLCSGLVKRISV